MASFKCKMCGGTLEIAAGTTVIECEYCGTQQTLPKLDDDKRANMYDRANHFRRNNEFDKAMGIYENILNEDNTDAEAYWSLVLCRYGIEYVEDPTSHKRIPTVNRAQFTSIFDDDNYKSALQYADSYQRTIYEAEAKAINEIQKGILAISQKEEPFDVFICYKESDNNGRRTPDSVLAQDLYYQLKQEGFKVFFARITLEDKLGSAYEPYIFAALNSAKAMVVLGTKPEFFNAVWVKNEWSRYLSLIKLGQKKVLIPAYKDMDPYDLPEEFSHLQAQDMSKLGFMQDLIRGIKKIAKSDEPKVTVVKETVVTSASTSTAPLLKRAFMFLEDGDWNSANEYCEKVLDIDPENAQAYLGKFLAQNNIKNEASIVKSYILPDKIKANEHFNKAIRFSDASHRIVLNDYIKEIDDRYHKNPWARSSADIRPGVTSITIPEGVTEIEYGAFADCSSLTSITIPNSVKIINGNAFYGCSSITSINIPYGVTTISSCAFCDCTSLTTITIPDSVKIIEGNAFDGCSSITNINIPHSVTSIELSTFKDCTSLININIPNGVSNIEPHAFAGCYSLKSITIPDTVTSIGDYAFCGCSSLTNINIPDSVTSIGYNAFKGCSSLTNINIPDSVTSIDKDSFEGCSSLTSITIHSNIINNLWLRHIPSLRSITISSGTSIPKEIFKDFKKVKNITIINSVSRIVEPAHADGSFITISIPDSVISIGDNAFEGCSSLTSITLPNNITNIGKHAFCGCSSLTSIAIPDKVTSVGESAFYNCNSLSNITIPNSVTSIGHSAFCGCSSLSSITLPNNITNIEPCTFQGCHSLTNIIISDSVTSIRGSAFCGCSSLTSINIPDSVTSIEAYTFFMCPSLINVTIPAGVTHIGNHAFDRELDDSISSKKRIIYHGTKEQWKNLCSQHTNDNLAKVSCSDGSAKISGCYIATCVYGSYDCPEVWTLRRFRDDTLGSTWYGRLFIRAYYAISPTLVKWFGNTNWFKKLWKGKLDLIVKKLQHKGVESSPYEDKIW